jgi:uncharacterized membrane protein YjfL (UPF0719 family)
MIGLAFAFVKLFVGFILALFSVYYGVRFFDKLTRNIEEWNEMKKGNTAVGILLSGVVFSIIIIVSPGISNLLAAIRLDSAGQINWLFVGLGILDFFVAFLLALFSIYIAVRLLDEMTVDVDNIAALKKGNVGVGIFITAVLLSLSFIIASLIPQVLYYINKAIEFALLPPS